MRKLLYTFAALASMLAVAVSCQRETPLDTDPVADGASVQVTFDVSLDGFASTKAYSVGSSVNKLSFLVYDQNGNQITGLTKLNVDSFNPSGSTSVSVSLVKGVKYNFVFFAQNGDHYTINAAAKTLTVADATGMMNNDGYDAFYARLTNYEVPTASFTKDVELKRPFAQINVGATDYSDATANGFDLSTLQTAYSLDVPTTMNLLTGAVGDPTSVVATLVDAPSVSSENLTVGGTDYGYMSMAYVLCDPSTGSTADVTLRLKASQNGTPLATEITRVFSAIPLKQNYRTNILGAILTTTGNFNVTIDHVYSEIGSTGDGIQVVDAENVATANTLFAASPMITYGVNILNSPNSSTEAEYTIKLPKTSENIYIGLNYEATTQPFKIVYADGATDSEKPANLYIYAINSGKVTAIVPQTHVELVSGSTVYGAQVYTSETTFVIQPTAVVKETLEVKAGSVEVAGHVDKVDVAKDSEYEEQTTVVKVVDKGTIGTLDVEKNTTVNVESEDAKITAITSEGGSAPENVIIIKVSDDNIGSNESGVEAKQDGFAEVEGGYEISNAKGLAYFRDQVNAGNTFSGKTVTLIEDIDLENAPWIPIGINGDAAATAFQGTFDGGIHTISNLNVDLTEEPAYRAAGLFGATRGAVVIKNFTVSGASIKHLSTGSSTVNGIAVVVGSLSYTEGGTVENVKVVNAVIEGNRYIGGIAGYAKGTIKDCSIDGLTIVATPDNLSGSYDNGDKVGGILGFDNQGSTITGNAVKNFSIKGYRDLGGIVGCAYLNSTTVSGNTVTDGTITVDQQTNSYGTKTANAAAIVGRLQDGTLDAEANTSSNVVIQEDVASGISRSGNIYTVTSTATANTVISTIYTNAKNCGYTEFTINLPEGEFVLPTIVQQNITIHIDGAGEDTVLSVSGASQAYYGCTVDFSNLTLVGDTNTDFTKNHGLYHLSKETYTNVKFTKFRFFYAPECTLNNCKFVQDAYDYAFCSYGTKTMVLNDCEISCVGKAAKIYGVDSNNPATVTFNRCSFACDGSARQSANKDWKTALEIDARATVNTPFTVNINNTVSCTGFYTSENTAIAKTDANYQGTLYNVDNGSGSKIVVNIDGVQQTQAW